MFSVDMDSGLVKKSLEDLCREIGELKAESCQDEAGARPGPTKV